MADALKLTVEELKAKVEAGEIVVGDQIEIVEAATPETEAPTA